jgi:hypothetical protein
MTQTQSKHTQGPWTLDVTRSIIRDEHHGRKIVTLNDDGQFAFHQDEMHANARLIAAAPELLGALTAVLANVCQAHGLPTHVEAQAHAAIAKAKGKA